MKDGDKAVDDFHAHLEVCKQCEEHLHNLCPTGVELINKIVSDCWITKLKK
jgi:hypothetical protein